jgi:predicted XRE-type DNA-binding protein
MPILESYGNSTEVSLMARKKNKSDSYQYKIVEIAVDPMILNDFPYVESLGSQLNLSKHSEEFYELKSRLMKEVLRIINSSLTPRQCEVVTLRLQGKTQIQIAEQLGIHQTTVHKLIQGNIDYSNGKKRYGGAIKKLKKLCAKDDKVLKILEEMRQIRARSCYEENLLNFDAIFGGLKDD